MTVMNLSLTGAPNTSVSDWASINWQKVAAHVRRLQKRIAKAFREGKRGKAKALQWILTHSFYAKLLAVKRVTSNQGANTPGVDNVVWRTQKQKLEAALSLKRRGYVAKPLRRIYIPKKQPGQYRPLSIPVMSCRAQQALYLLALEPIAETMSDRNAYGFRPKRSTADAIGQCFRALCHRTSAEYILEGDIKSCFDTISHSWLEQHVPMDTQVLKKWLAAGYLEQGQYFTSQSGTPQGGIISPTLLNITLSGLERAVKAATKRDDKVNVIIYADDFVITGKSKALLENTIYPVVEQFLQERGLALSKEKTQITTIQEGFDFLGVNSRKYSNGVLIQKPAKDSVKRFMRDIRETVKQNKAVKTEALIRRLNQKLTGWANYYQPYCSKDTFAYIQNQLFPILWRWARNRHQRKGAKWVIRKYFRSTNHRRWQFTTKIKSKGLGISYFDLVNVARIPIRRHIKIKADATPYDPAYEQYFRVREARRKKKQLFLPCKSHWSPYWEYNLEC